MFFIKHANLVGDTRTNGHCNGANPSSKNLEIFFIRVCPFVRVSPTNFSGFMKNIKKVEHYIFLMNYKTMYIYIYTDQEVSRPQKNHSPD